MSDQAVLGEVICAIGVFDGMHLGHQYLLAQAQAQADEVGLPLVVVTFDRDPDELLTPDAGPTKLLSDPERLARLHRADNGGARLAQASTGPSSACERVIVSLPFEQWLADLAPEDFLDQVVARRCTPRGIHVGSDFRFGAKAAGSIETLRQWASRHGAEAFGHKLLDDGGLPVSATRIRECLAQARLTEANRLLTRPHHLPGLIVRGRGFGREMGFPTANISGQGGVMQPADGVYAGFFEIGGELLMAAVSVGVPLTFEGLEATLEAYVLDFDGDLYERQATIHFIEYLRPMQDFGEVSRLMEQIGRDVERTREVCAAARGLLG
jgi:riboflavin kinase/FMN adenylyltransferase